MTRRAVLLCLPFLIAVAALGAQARLSTSMGPVILYNGYVEDGSGEPVQGSDSGPIAYSGGIALDVPLRDWGAFRPALWLTPHTYLADRDGGFVVPTQIESGAVLGDIATTLVTALDLPLIVRLDPGATGGAQIDLGLGTALIFRIPLVAHDGTDPAPIGRHWISAGRFVYPSTGVGVLLPLSARWDVRAAADVYWPLANAWAPRPEAARALDGLMVRLSAAVSRPRR